MMLSIISRRDQKRNKNSANGFTLVEVLVSLIVFSLLMVATGAAMRTFGKTQVAVEAVAYRAEDIRMVSRFVRSSLEGVQASATGSSLGLSTGGGPTQSAASYFAGKESELTWSAPILLGELSGGTLALHLSREKGQLVLRWLDLQGPRSDYQWQAASSKILLDKVESIEVQYRPAFGEAWENTWERGIPVAVKINLKVNGRYWPELIISL